MNVMLMTSSIGGITAPLTAAARAAGSATVFYTIIDAPKPYIGGIKGPEATAAEDIVLDHVNFVYPTRPHIKILDDLSLRFPAGKVTAIVGPSGSGKSTIVGLLERWYELDGDLATNIGVSLSRLQPVVPANDCRLSGYEMVPLPLPAHRSKMSISSGGDRRSALCNKSRSCSTTAFTGTSSTV